MRKRVLLLLCVTLLAGCDSTGTDMYDRSGTRTGRVTVASADSATVYNRDGTQVGSVSTDTVYDRNGIRKGRVASDATVYDRNGTRVGSLSSGTVCLNRNGLNEGHLSAKVDREAAGGACLLLILQ